MSRNSPVRHPGQMSQHSNFITTSKCEGSEYVLPNSAESSQAQLSYPHIQRTFEPSLQSSVDQLPPTLDTTSILHDTTKRHIAFTTTVTKLIVVQWRLLKSMQSSDVRVYLSLHRKQILLRAGHLHGHIIPRIFELGGVWDGELSLSEKICL